MASVCDLTEGVSLGTLYLKAEDDLFFTEGSKIAAV